MFPNGGRWEREVNRLRRKVFPNGGRWKTLEPKLYSSMMEILREAQKGPNVVADGREIGKRYP